MDSIVKSPTTLAILFGASAFPDADLPAYASFGRSVDRFKSYLLESLAVQPDNIFNMFDSDAWPGELGDSIEEWIKARKEAGFTQREVSACMGRSHNFLTKCETGERSIDVMELLELAMLYRKPVTHFLAEP